MKQLLLVILLTVFLTIQSPAQERNDNPLQNIQNGIGTQYNTGYILNLLPLNNFTMNHQFSSSFMTGGGHSMMMNSYLNTMIFKFKFPLTIKLDLGLASSPYSSNEMNSNFQSQLFGQLSMQYKPSKNTMIGLSISKGPGIYNPYWNFPFYQSPTSYFNEN